MGFLYHISNDVCIMCKWTCLVELALQSTDNNYYRATDQRTVYSRSLLKLHDVMTSMLVFSFKLIATSSDYLSLFLF